MIVQVPIRGRFAQAHRVLLATAAALAPLLACHAAVPDLSGTWGVYPPFAGGADPKLVPPPAGPLALRPKYAGPYQARRAAERESDKRGEPLATPGTDCLPNGMPQMMFAIYPIEVMQTPKRVTIIAEVLSQVRRIYLDAPQAAIGDVAPGFFGHSVGHWEGDTLVVDTIGIKDYVLGYKEIPHSDQMRITERIHLVTPDIMHDQITVEDPVVLEKPWIFTFGYKRLPDYKMMEYVCENNREYIDDKGVTQMKLHPH
jgi:hypothetical protein